MKFFLIVAKGRNKGMPILIRVDLFLIGSDPMCQLRKRTLGSKHCALVTRDKKVFIRDLDSGYETIVNGSAIPTGAEWPLHSGDRINVGILEFLVQFREKELAQKDLEEWAMRSLDVQREVEATEEDDLRSKEDAFRSASHAAQSILNKLSGMKGNVVGRLRIGVDSGVTVVQFNDARLIEESEIAMIKKELCDNLNKPNLRVLLDLKAVRKLSSQAVIMLTDFARWLRPWSSTLAFCRVRPELESALGMLQVENIPIYKDKGTALASKW